MEIKVAPSIMCCKGEEFVPYLELFEKVNVSSIHFDVMDGHYVPNVMLSTRDYKDIKRLSKLPVDLHMMTDMPERFLDFYDVQPGDRVAFHPETSRHPYKLIQTIHEKGCEAGLVINPGTPLGFVEECINLIDYVIVMAVNPGFAGQKMVPDAPNKIRRTKELLDKYNKKIDIMVDGNTTLENSLIMKEAGANVFIGGTSCIMKGVENFEEIYNEYYEALK